MPEPATTVFAPGSWAGDPAWAATQAAGPGSASPIEAYMSPDDPWLTTSYFLDTGDGVVLFDTQLYDRSARELLAAIDERTGGAPLRAIVLTHAHADHVFGLAELRRAAPGAAVITSFRVAEELRATLADLTTGLHGWLGDEVLAAPHAAVRADVEFWGMLELRFGGQRIVLQDLGRSEATAHVLAWLPEVRTAIAGDLVQNRQHLWVEHRATQSWRQQLHALEALRPRLVCTGHRGVAGPELIGETSRWLATFDERLAAELPPGAHPEDPWPLDAAARRRLADGMREAFPEWYDPMMPGGLRCLESGIAAACFVPGGEVA